MVVREKDVHNKARWRNKGWDKKHRKKYWHDSCDAHNTSGLLGTTPVAVVAINRRTQVIACKCVYIHIQHVMKYVLLGMKRIHAMCRNVFSKCVSETAPKTPLVLILSSKSYASLPIWIVRDLNVTRARTETERREVQTEKGVAENTAQGEECQQWTFQSGE